MRPNDDSDDFDFDDADFGDPDWFPPEPKPTVAARLVDLVFLLTRRTCTLAEIRERFEPMGEYLGTSNTARQKFRRDCAKLRALGIDVVEDGDTYRIPTGDHPLSRRLSPEETTALALACRRVLPGVSAEVRRALNVGLAKLGAEATLDDLPWEARVPAPATLLPVLAACRGRVLRIGYTNAAGDHSQRAVHPWAVRCTEGNWYVRAWDELTGSARTFKLDRIDPDPELLAPSTPAVAAPDVTAAAAELGASPWEWGDAEPHEVLLRLDGDRPDRLLPEGAVVDEYADGDVQTARMLVRDDDNFATTVLRLGGDVTVVSPASTRDAVVARLDATITALAGAAPATPALSPHQPARRTQHPDLARTDRLLRLIGIAHSSEGGEARFDADELCTALQCSPDDLREDMALLTHWCGIPPFLGADTVSATKDRGEVSLVSAPLPLVASLTDWEAAALAVAVRLAAEVEPQDSERSLLHGILEVLRVDPDSFPVVRPQVDVVAAEGTPGGILADAIARERRCEIFHRSPGAAPKARSVDPWRLGNARGRTYLSGYDHDAAAVRMFRLDRVEAVRVFDDAICHHQDVDIPPDANRITGAGDTEVVVSVPPDHVAWAAGRYGADAVRDSADGDLFLVLPTGDVDRLAPTLLALAPRCAVVSPVEARTAVATLARRVLALYSG